jgi:hypothetical protein
VIERPWLSPKIGFERQKLMILAASKEFLLELQSQSEKYILNADAESRKSIKSEGSRKFVDQLPGQKKRTFRN